MVTWLLVLSEFETLYKGCLILYVGKNKTTSILCVGENTVAMWLTKSRKDGRNPKGKLIFDYIEHVMYWVKFI